jgi:hypothetical protein
VIQLAKTGGKFSADNTITVDANKADEAVATINCEIGSARFPSPKAVAYGF